MVLSAALILHGHLTSQYSVCFVCMSQQSVNCLIITTEQVIYRLLIYMSKAANFVRITVLHLYMYGSSNHAE